MREERKEGEIDTHKCLCLDQISNHAVCRQKKRHLETEGYLIIYCSVFSV